MREEEMESDSRSADEEEHRMDECDRVEGRDERIEMRDGK